MTWAIAIAIYSYRHLIVFSDTEGHVDLLQSSQSRGLIARLCADPWREKLVYTTFNEILANIAIISWAKQSYAWKGLNMHAPPQLYSTMHALCTHACRHSVLHGYACHIKHVAPKTMAILHPPWTVTRWLHEIYGLTSRCHPPPFLQCTSYKYIAIYSYI